LTAKADDKTKAYRTTNPELTITYEGFVNGDTASDITGVAISTTAEQYSGLGEYGIVLNVIQEKNYSIQTKNGTLRIFKSAKPSAEILTPIS
jgi:hypothetical protein